MRWPEWNNKDRTETWPVLRDSLIWLLSLTYLSVMIFSGVLSLSSFSYRKIKTREGKPLLFGWVAGIFSQKKYFKAVFCWASVRISYLQNECGASGFHGHITLLQKSFSWQSSVEARKHDLMGIINIIRSARSCLGNRAYGGILVVHSSMLFFPIPWCI